MFIQRLDEDRHVGGNFEEGGAVRFNGHGSDDLLAVPSAVVTSGVGVAIAAETVVMGADAELLDDALWISFEARALRHVGHIDEAFVLL